MNEHTPFDEFLADYVTSRGFTACARNQYKAAVTYLCNYVGREVVLRELTEELVNGFLRSLSETKTTVFVLRTRGLICAMWRDAQARGLVTSWPITTAGEVEIKVSERKSNGPVVSLVKLLEESYIAERLADSPEESKAKFRGIVQLFSWYLGRDPLVGDLNTETLDDFSQYLERHRRQRGTIRHHRLRLYSLARHARAKGLLDKLPDAIEPQARGAMGRAVIPSLPGSLGAFYWNKYRPKILAHSDESTLAHHDKIVGQFGEFSGASTKLVTIDPAKLTAFRKWLIEKYVPANVAESYLDTVCKIIANTTPEDLAQPQKPDPETTLPTTKGPCMSLRDFMESVYFMERQVRPKTQDQMRNAIEQAETWAGRELSLSDLTAQTLNAYIAFMRARYSAATVKGRRGYLVGIWNLAYEAGYVETMPTRRVARVKVGRKIPKAWTPEEMVKILSACHSLKGRLHRTGIPKSLFMRAAILICYDTGLRRGDVLSLRCEQLSKDGTLVVPMQKTGQDHRCRIRPETMEALEATLGDGNREFLLPVPSDRILYDMWHAILDKAGIDRTERGGFQKIRRLSASLVEREQHGAAGAFLGT